MFHRHSKYTLCIPNTTIRVPLCFPAPTTLLFLLPLNSFLRLFFFFFNIPKQVVFSFMFGSILSPNSPIYFIFQLIQIISCFIFVVSIKATWIRSFYTSAFHFFFTFWVSLCGHCSVEHFCGFSTYRVLIPVQ